jgi:hypothetical protein
MVRFATPARVMEGDGTAAVRLDPRSTLGVARRWQDSHAAFVRALYARAGPGRANCA